MAPAASCGHLCIIKNRMSCWVETRKILSYFDGYMNQSPRGKITLGYPSISLN